MRTFEAFVGNPFFGLGVALVLVVIGARLNAQGEHWILLTAWFLFVISLFRTAPISKQDLLPRSLFTLAVASIVGLGLCWLAGWRPVIAQNSLRPFVIINDSEYPSGTNLGNIPWSPRFSDLRVIIPNESDSDYRDIDLVLRPDAPVAAIGQITNLPDVTFSPVAEPSFTQQLVIGATGQRITNPLVLVASDSGYRMRCGLLPHKRKLEIILAVAEIVDFPKPGSKRTVKPDFGMSDRGYVLRIGMTNNESKVETANWYGHGTDAGGRIEDVYKKNRPVPKTVWIEGRYMADGEDLTIAQKVDATDVVGDFLRQKLSSN